MKKALSLIIAVVMCVGMFAMTALAANTNYTQNWNNGKGSSTFTDKSGGGFAVTWTLNPGGNFVGGKGWNPGSKTAVIGYNAGVFSQTSSTGCSYLSLYGWTTNSLVEYYIMDNWVNYQPKEGDNKGSYTCDGQTYTLYKHQQVNQPSISGTQTFYQALSLNNSKRALGTNNTVTFATHLSKWVSAGIVSSSCSMNYQMLAFEGYESTGKGDATVWSTP